MNSISTWIIVTVVCVLIHRSKSHSRLVTPPGRSTMWRQGFPTPVNVDDNELYCGGMTVQWQHNGGKCGICGDPYHMPHPRKNEAGGKYATGVIGAHYTAGQIIDVVVEMTANHKGYMTFKLCPNNNVKVEATQECLDKHVLKQPNGESKIDVTTAGNGNIAAKLLLPEGLTCSQCVLQWEYKAGNNPGKCEDGSIKLGCGAQETFRACADIEITGAVDASTLSSSDSNGIVDPNVPPFFNSINFLFVKSPTAALKDLDLKDGYFLIPNTNVVPDRSESRQNVPYFFIPKGTPLPM